jgi:NADH-quinone oxidoreductase subunit M
MLGETNNKIFKEVTFVEGTTFVIIIAFLLFFGLYPKPIIDLVLPSLKEIVSTINRFN